MVLPSPQIDQGYSMRQAAGALPASVGQHSCGDKARIPNGLTPDSSPGMAHTDSAGHHSNEGEREEPGKHNLRRWPLGQSH